MSNGVENDVKGLLTGGGGWEGWHKKEWKEKSSTMGKNLVKTQSESSGKCGAGADEVVKISRHNYWTCPESHFLT